MTQLDLYLRHGDEMLPIVDGVACGDVQGRLQLEPKQPSAKTLNQMVLERLQSGHWLTPHQICDSFAYFEDVWISDSSCTARIRDLRKPQYGSHTIEKRRREGSNAFEYRLTQ
jgi:hypothetical protein